MYMRAFYSSLTRISILYLLFFNLHLFFIFKFLTEESICYIVHLMRSD